MQDGSFATQKRVGTQTQSAFIRQKLRAFITLARFPYRFQFPILAVLFMMTFENGVFNIPLLLTGFVVVALMNAGGCA
ncbi:MAG: hypothetical protein ACXV2A_06005, partial [Halobacteriota archaeon]